MTDAPRPALLEPDRNQIEIFVDALFRHAGTQGYVSVRSFVEDDATKPFRITPTSLKGGLKFLVDVAEDDARRAAQDPKRVVFCPPIAAFASRDSAAEKNLAEGYALSVECDQRPDEARETLERRLGPATVVIRSGGVWTDPAGAPHDKLHLHWRLATPARGASLPKLKALRELAARVVGGDPTSNSICHPIRWPGSWWRKREPARLCEIAAINADREIDLDAAFDILAAEAEKLPGARPNGSGGAAGPGLGGEDKLDWTDAFEKILTGASYHPTLAPLASSFAGRGIPEPAAHDALRALLFNSNPQDPERQRRRDVELEKLSETVSSGYGKFGHGGGAAWSAIDLPLLFGVEMAPPELTHDMLPADWVNLIWASAFSAAAPPDYTANAMIVAAAGAIGNARVAFARPGWTEAVVLWGALVGAPSAHKSPAMNDARGAVAHIDKKLFAQWRFACEQIEADYQIELEQAAQNNKKGKPAKPPLPQLLYDDVTLEKLTISMADNPHGALVVYDELAAWFSSFGRYATDGDSSGARAFWNKSYNAGPHKRDRVKNEGPPVFIPRAACSVTGAIQPERLRQFWNSANDGMLARIMFVWPRLAAVKAIDFDASQQEHDDLTHKLKRAYQALFDLKLDSPDGEAQPRMLALAADARGAFNDAHLRCEEKSRRAKGALAEWLGKGPGRILRLALTFEMMAWALEPTASEPEEIGADAMARAIRYFGYLAAMFARTMAGIEPAEAGGDAIAIAKLIVKRQWPHFADRDIGRETGFRWYRGEHRKDKERRDNAIGVLVDANVIRREKVQTGRGFLEMWAVSPDLPAALAG